MTHENFKPNIPHTQDQTYAVGFFNRNKLNPIMEYDKIKLDNFGRRNIMSTIQNTVTDKFSIKSK